MVNINKRKSISKKIRFEVFKRDKFKCVYCGAVAPDVLLQIDHINPVAKGGDNDILNLVTACFECNSGKRDKMLDDKSIIQKKRNQLEELQQRREQIEMMLEWHNELSEIKDILLFELKKYWEDHTPGYSINDLGLKKLKKLIRDFTYEEIRESMDISVEQYINIKNDTITKQSCELAFNKIGGIAKIRKDSKENPDLKEIYYIRGILKNKIRGYYDPSLSLNLLKSARQHGVPLEDIRYLALKTNYMDDFEEEINEIINKFINRE
jgi:DNA-binding transcriptional MerR regulator